MPVADPIRVLDAKGLDAGRFDMARATKAAKQHQREFNRALKERGWDIPSDDDGMPSDEEIVGYVSNTRAWLDNESRRMKEVVVDLSATPANRETILQWISGVSERGWNNRDFDLSMVSHTRAAVRRQWHDLGEENGAEKFAMVIPPSKEESISISGVLSEHVGRVRTADEWHAAAKTVNRDRSGLSLVFSLGMHHNDPHQMLPIPAGKLAAAVKVMAGYREQFFKRRKRAARRDEE